MTKQQTNKTLTEWGCKCNAAVVMGCCGLRRPMVSASAPTSRIRKSGGCILLFSTEPVTRRNQVLALTISYVLPQAPCLHKCPVSKTSAGTHLCITVEQASPTSGPARHQENPTVPPIHAIPPSTCCFSVCHCPLYYHFLHWPNWLILYYPLYSVSLPSLAFYTLFSF